MYFASTFPTDYPALEAPYEATESFVMNCTEGLASILTSIFIVLLSPIVLIPVALVSAIFIAERIFIKGARKKEKDDFIPLHISRRIYEDQPKEELPKRELPQKEHFESTVLNIKSDPSYDARKNLLDWLEKQYLIPTIMLAENADETNQRENLRRIEVILKNALEYVQTMKK